MRADVQGGAQAQAEAARAVLEAVGHDDGVLARGQKETLLDADALGDEGPHGQAQLEPELREGRAVELELAPVGQHDPLDELIEHHRAPERVAQRRDEQPVEPARDDARDRPRRVAANAVADEPLAVDGDIRRRRAPRETDERGHGRGGHDVTSCRAGTNSTAASPGRNSAWPSSVSRTPSPP